MSGVRLVSATCLACCVGAAPVAGQSRAVTQAQQTIELALADPDYAWVQAETEHFRLHYPAGVLTPTGVDNVGKRLEDSLTRNLELLKEQYDPEPIRTLLVGSREQMAQVVGAPYGGVALASQRSLVLVTSPDGQAATQHELMHLLAFELWEEPREPRQWVSEGLATYAPGRCAEFTIPSLAALMADSGVLPTLDALVNDFNGISDLYSYLAGASFVQFVAERSGVSGVHSLWSDGLESGAQSLGTTVGSLQEAWTASLSSASPAPSDAWDRIRAVGCEGP